MLEMRGAMMASTRRYAFCAFVMTLTVSRFASPQAAAPLDPSLNIVTIPLYARSSTGVTNKGVSESTPTLTVFAPVQGLANGSAVIIAPGGAYLRLSSNLEGREVADWFAAHGVTAFVLHYRLGPKNIFPVPLFDMQRAVRLVRSLADSYGISTERIGVVGFSAGGHLAAEVATNTDRPPSPSFDVIDRLSSRPDFIVLGYPWLNAMERSVHGEITYCSMMRVLSDVECEALTQPYTPRFHVTAATPPTFIYATSDDSVVPVRASVEFYTAMNAVGAPVEMHLFSHGTHGSGLGLGDFALDQWPLLLENWLRMRGLLSPVAGIAAIPSKQ